MPGAKGPIPKAPLLLASLRLTGAILHHILPAMPGAPFTAESARIAGEAGRLAQQRARVARAERMANHSNGEEFRQDTLARVREILADTLDRMSKAHDPKDRELLARATSHLAETERKLAGRPLPGTVNRSRGEAPPPSPGLPQPR